MSRPRLAAALALVVGFFCPVTRAQTTAPSYPGNSQGLTHLFTDMLAAADAQQTDKLLAMCQSLVLPDPPKWFKATFGNDVGTKLAEAYQKDMKDFGPGLAVLILRLKDPKDLTITIECIETPDDPNAKMYQVYALQAMRRPIPLYALSIGKEGTIASIGLWSFVHVDGTFRLAGKMTTIREARGNPGTRR